MGYRAVELLLKGQYGCMVGVRANAIIAVPLSTVLRRKKAVDLESYRLGQILAK
jgi:6-phosphofructokinase 1